MRTKLVAFVVLVACAKTPAESSEGTTSTGGGESTTTTTTTSESSTGALPPGTGCCAPHDAAGCDEAAVAACVCAAAPECCTFHWDAACVDAAMSSCAPTCMPDPAEGTTGPTSNEDSGPIDTGNVDGSTGDAPPNDGPCCEQVEFGAGCSDAMVTECVCGIDPYCCEMAWDNYCVAEAAQSCQVDCMNDCCMPHDADACNDADVFDCVLQENDGCWDMWTQDCVDIATMSCGLMC